MNQMGNKDSAPVLRDEDVAMLAETSGLGEEVEASNLGYGLQGC